MIEPFHRVGLGLNASSSTVKIGWMRYMNAEVFQSRQTQLCPVDVLDGCGRSEFGWIDSCVCGFAWLGAF